MNGLARKRLHEAHGALALIALVAAVAAFASDGWERAVFAAVLVLTVLPAIAAAYTPDDGPFVDPHGRPVDRRPSEDRAGKTPN